MLFQDLIEKLEKSRTDWDAVGAMQGFADRFGLNHHAYLGFRGGDAPDAVPFRMGTYPAGWSDTYMEAQLYKIDPVITGAKAATLPFFWRGKDYHGDPKVRLLFDQAAKNRIRSGYTIPIRSSIGQIATLTFASNEDGDTFEKHLSEHLSALHLAAFYYHTALERHRAGEGNPTLTARERLCLTYVAQGYTATEIAAILKITSRAIKFHLDNARLKLGASNRQHAVYLASVQNLL